MKMLRLSILMIVSAYAGSDPTESLPRLCLDEKTENVKLHLATKTPYRFIYNQNDTVVTYQGCRPRRMWSIIRHGTRNPKEKQINAINAHLVNIRNEIVNKQNPQLCSKDIERLRSWQFHLNANEQKYLTHEGIDELIELAERFQNRFPTILPEQYHNEWYKFKFTETQRTLKSFEAFVTGLFGRNNVKQVQYLPASTKDPILRFYKLCSKWAVDVDDNPDALMEPKKWLESEQMTNLLRELREKLDLEYLMTADILLMYTVCGFETAWCKFEYSPWCSIFNENQLKMLEFYSDLKYYWNDGYGFSINHQQACPAVKDMIDHLDLNSTKPNATFYFTHSGTMLKMLAHLGLYKDDFVLSHNDFLKNRMWRVGNIDAFASNLAFVAFECSTEPHVLVLHQEKTVKIPGCPVDSDLCSFSTFKKVFNKSLYHCDFDTVCDNTKATKPW